jgi:hypothetical protein
MKPRQPDNPEQKKDQTIESDAPLQGEGNYTAARRYDKAQEKFVQSGQVDDAARRAEPGSAEERDELQKSEEEGRRHARK